MNVYDLIYRKRNGEALDERSLYAIVAGYTAGSVPDYQMSAFLMAVYFSGMNNEELSILTRAMIQSGETLDLSRVGGVKVDKHSTGGVGDGTSLVLVPLVASCGAVVPMMSGRGLGHTGGTLDKLESIPGFTVQLSYDELCAQLSAIGCAMIGQSDTIVPADKKMYALRDVTATVDSIPLIAASIMSKKIAEGSDALVLDVKTGSGAFMPNAKKAYALATTMVDIGTRHGKKTRAVITDMNQPLGNAIGNALEVRQAIDVLNGKGPEDFKELTIALGARMLVVAQLEPNLACAEKKLSEHLANGKALEKFRALITAQKGNPRVADEPEKYLPSARHKEDVYAQYPGFVASIDTRMLGLACVLLGAGRQRKEDTIDFGAGMVVHKKLGARADATEPVATLYYSDGCDLQNVVCMVQQAFQVSQSTPEPPPLLYKDIQ